VSRAAATAAGRFAAALLGASAPFAQEAPSPRETPLDGPVFVERPDCGIDFVHRRYQTAGKKYLPETAGSGVGLLDYDRDGDLDVYCVQCCPLPGYSGGEPAEPDLLYRNEGGLRFVQVPVQGDEREGGENGGSAQRPGEAAGARRRRLGLGDLHYGMGVTCPDVDNDGWPDLFVTNVGRDVLYRNDRDGSFTDVTAQAGIEDDFWSTAAGWADLDGDGDLDLYLANYALIDFASYRPCGRPPEIISYCHPDTLTAAPDRLWRNDSTPERGIRFTEITKEAGIVEPDEGGKGLAVIPFDQDGDGRLDLYVANDADENYLWMNRGGLRFEEEAGWFGVAVSGRGSSQSCMGSDLADVDGDLDFDLFSANFGKEPNVLYVRGEDGFYEDRSYPSGLGEPSYLFTGFGSRFFDQDRDGDQDLIVVNGHIVDDAHLLDPSQTFEQVPHFYENRGDGTFREIGSKLSPFFRRPDVGRGLATGDLDDDGDLDVVVLENDHPVVLLENRVANANRWIGLSLTGTRSPRDAIGATVLLECAGRRQIQIVTGTASYLSWNDLRLFFGVGPVDAAKTRASATLRWPSGAWQRLPDLQLDRYHAVSEPVR
jgi:hypothetical protein